MQPSTILFVALLSVCAAAAADGGQAPPAELPFAIDAPPPPALPERIARDGEGRATIRTIRLDQPLRMDGRLDEPVYHQERPVSDFIQTDPIEGAPATEKTELWIMFDRENVYVAFRVFESQPARRVANVMQKDHGILFQNDGVMFVFDPFYDRRNGVGFMINAIGGRTDGQVTDERWSRDWNTVWELQVADFEGGWTAEVALPFKSLRYRPGSAQVWGFNARRIDRWKNEYSHLMPVERQEAGSGVYRMSRAATLIGLEAPSGSKNLEFKPYAISNASSNRAIAGGGATAARQHVPLEADGRWSTSRRAARQCRAHGPPTSRVGVIATGRSVTGGRHRGERRLRRRRRLRFLHESRN